MSIIMELLLINIINKLSSEARSQSIEIARLSDGDYAESLLRTVPEYVHGGGKYVDFHVKFRIYISFGTEEMKDIVRGEFRRGRTYFHLGNYLGVKFKRGRSNSFHLGNYFRLT